MNAVILSGAVNFLGNAEDRRFHVIKKPSATVRVRISSPDPFGGARGHDYIRLRGLAPKVGSLSSASREKECQCYPCVQARLLPAVQAICDRRRNQIPIEAFPTIVGWNDLNNDEVLALLDVPIGTEG